jgi:rhodanese-related sulfurtransferase
MNEIDVKKAAKLVKEGRAILLDVRTSFETDLNKIKGAKNIPLNETPKNNKITCICRTSNRSKIACKILEENGFENVFNIKRELSNWKN